MLKTVFTKKREILENFQNRVQDLACLGRFFKPGRPMPLEIEDNIVDLDNAGYRSAGQQL